MRKKCSCSEGERGRIAAAKTTRLVKKATLGYDENLSADVDLNATAAVLNNYEASRKKKITQLNFA